MLYLTEAYSYTNDCNRMLKYLQPRCNVCVHVQINIMCECNTIYHKYIQIERSG